MKKHVHSEQILQFAAMVAAGYPIDTLIQTRRSVACSWQGIVNPVWSEDWEYRVACAVINGTPVFEGAEVRLDVQLGHIRWEGQIGYVVFEVVKDPIRTE